MRKELKGIKKLNLQKKTIKKLNPSGMKQIQGGALVKTVNTIHTTR
jgi:hypothetical protein